MRLPSAPFYVQELRRIGDPEATAPDEVFAAQVGGREELGSRVDFGVPDLN